jgi:hypothetical protein
MNKYLDNVSIPVELGMHSEIKNGYINCPKYFRLLDVLNGDGYDNANFIELANSPDVNEGIATADKPQVCVRKSAVELVAVSESNLARGLGAESGWRSYPFMLKKPVQVSLQLQSYSLVGTLHLSEAQTVPELLNEKNLFLPITDVTISHEFRLYGTRPLAIVNKDHIMLSREGKVDRVKSRFSSTVSVG